MDSEKYWGQGHAESEKHFKAKCSCDTHGLLLVSEVQQHCMVFIFPWSQLIIIIVAKSDMHSALLGKWKDFAE